MPLFGHVRWMSMIPCPWGADWRLDCPCLCNKDDRRVSTWV
jgi:hypothetical protein